MGQTRLAILRWRIVQAIDFIDDRIIGHRIHAICQWCGSSDWWAAGYHQPGATCPVDYDMYREYAPYRNDPIDLPDNRTVVRRLAGLLRRG